MESIHRIRLSLKIALFLICAMLMTVGTARAQGAGGDLGGGAGIFRPKNPETHSKRRTGIKPPTVARTTSVKPRTSRTAVAVTNTAEVEERVEDALDEGNEARDARKYAEAEQAYRTALQLKPRDARAAYGLGNIYTDQQRWDEAEKAYRQAVEWNQLNVDAFVALSYVLVQQRQSGGNAKRLADAEDAARRAIQLQSTNAIAYDRLGQALEARGITNSDTEQAYRRAVELDPQFAVAYVHIAQLLRKSGRRAEADPLLKRAIELAHDAPTLILIADSLQSDQRYDEADPLLKRALEIDAKNPNALFLLGRSYIVRKNYKEAEPLLLSAIEVSPRSFSPYYVLGSAYLRMDRYDDAEKLYVRAAQIASAGDRKLLAGSFGLEGVGDGYLKAGRASDALRVYERAAQLDPANTNLQSKLADARARLNK